MTTGKRLRIARTACGVTQQEVSEALGLVRFTLMRWEKDDRIPSDMDIQTLARIYQVTPGWILGEKEDPPPERSLNRKEAARRFLLRLKSPSNTGLRADEGDYLSPLKRQRAYHFLLDPERGLEPGESDRGDAATHQAWLEEISARIQELLNSRPILPVIPGVHPEVIQAMKLGTVIPTSEILLQLAERTLVHPRWILFGEDGPALQD